LKRFFLAVALAAVASVIVAGAASAEVPRYQVPATGSVTATFSVFHPRAAFSQWVNTWQHDYTVQLNTKTGEFNGTGYEFNGQEPFSVATSVPETIHGFYNADDHTITFTAYQGNGGQQWYSLTNAKTDTDPADIQNTGSVQNAVTFPMSPYGVVESKVTQPQYDVPMTDLNHGQYVSSQGGGKDLAHSPIGMPLNSKSGK
jgi:hypothetical protein